MSNLCFVLAIFCPKRSVEKQLRAIIVAGCFATNRQPAVLPVFRPNRPLKQRFAAFCFKLA
jgi:hypothetical protein